MDIFRRAANEVKNSPFVLPITFVFTIMFIVGLAISIEDYSTTYFGYLAIPTRKANLWVIPLVALLPQIGQLGFGYAFASDTGKWWSLGIAGALHLVDAYTDVLYKIGGNGALTLTAIVETEVVYCLGSEVMTLLAFGMLVKLLPPALLQWHVFQDRWQQAQQRGRGTMSALGNMLTDEPPRSYPRSRPNGPLSGPQTTRPPANPEDLGPVGSWVRRGA